MKIRITVSIFTIFALTGCATSWQDSETSLGIPVGSAFTASEADDSNDADANAPASTGSFQKQLAVDRGQAYQSPDTQIILWQFMTAHEAVMGGIGELKESNQRVQSDLREIKATNQKALDTAQRSLLKIEEMASRQGTGELTVFFPVNSATIEVRSLEFERLVRFADFLSRESRGRKLSILSIGSASATGNRKTNLKLAQKRSEVPLEILDKYLINIPHEFYKVYGTGDLYSPQNVKLKEHQRYQHTRIIALFDLSLAPRINAEVRP